MIWSGHGSLDSYDIESAFSEEDSLAYMFSLMESVDADEFRERMAKVREIMGMLPRMEADFVDLYFFRQVRQTDIAHIFRVSQPTVCYRLQRATARIRFLLSLPQVFESDIRRDLSKVLHDPKDLEIVVGLWKTTCQSEVASSLGVTQGLVRHRLIRTLALLKADESLSVYYDLLLKVSQNLNILRDTPKSEEDGKRMYFVH